MTKLNEYLNQIQEIEPVTLSAVAAGAGIANAINFGVRTYKDYLSKNARRCSGLPADEKAICMLKLKALGKVQQAQALKDKAKCQKSKDPKKCMEKVKKKIDDFKHDAQMFQKRAMQLKKKQLGKKGE